MEKGWELEKLCGWWMICMSVSVLRRLLFLWYNGVIERLHKYKLSRLKLRPRSDFWGCFCVVLELFLVMVFFSAMLLSPDRLFKECNLFAWNPVKVCVNFLLLNLSEWFGPILIICHCPSFITSDLSAKPIAALLKWDKHDSL